MGRGDHCSLKAAANCKKRIGEISASRGLKHNLFSSSGVQVRFWRALPVCLCVSLLVIAENAAEVQRLSVGELVLQRPEREGERIPESHRVPTACCSLRHRHIDQRAAR